MSTLRCSNIQDIVGGNNTTPSQIKSGVVDAWVKFNGTGTVTINSSYNVSSITDEGVGLYRVNFSTAFADTNYAVTAFLQGCGIIAGLIPDNQCGGETTSWYRFRSITAGGTLYDTPQYHCLFIGNT